MHTEPMPTQTVTDLALISDLIRATSEHTWAQSALAAGHIGTAELHAARDAEDAARYAMMDRLGVAR